MHRNKNNYNILQTIYHTYKCIPYTFKHYIKFLQIEKKYIGYYKYKFHDIDKLLMYIFFPWLGSSKIHKIHKKYAKHHLMKGKKNMRFEEAVIDWESCRFTKPDKPLNAYETYLTKFTYFKNDIMPILVKFKLTEKQTKNS